MIGAALSFFSWVLPTRWVLPLLLLVVPLALVIAVSLVANTVSYQWERRALYRQEIMALPTLGELYERGYEIHEGELRNRLSGIILTKERILYWCAYYRHPEGAGWRCRKL